MAAALLAGGCTDPISRKKTSIAVGVDADRIVRDETVRVEIEVDRELAPDSGWQNIHARSFRDRQRAIRWPIEFTLSDMPELGHSYSLLAFAYDENDSIVARGQAIRDREHALENGLRVHFDSECIRQSDPCAQGQTCYRMQCVSATEETPRVPETPGDMTADGGTPSDPNAGVEQDGESCDTEGARACGGNASRVALRCEGGHWLASMCPETERCETQGSDRGACKPMARECVNQEPGVPFCAAEKMLVCKDLVSSMVRRCNDNMSCAPTPTGATCVCLPGFVPDGLRCSAATKCGDDNGGCDKLTECSMTSDGRICSACPPGYAGSGDTGCEPLLISLTPSAGALESPITPDGRAYRIRVPIVSPRVQLTAQAPDDTRVSFDSTEVATGAPWTSPILKFGEQTVELVLTSEAGVSTRYAITLVHTGAQTEYIKASNADANDWFGIALAGSGDTFVAGAYFEDSAARGVGGDQGNGSRDTGAAYVFVREGDRITQQAYLKQSDTAAEDFFGTSVSIEGDVLAVGAVHSSLFGTPSADDRSGAAYVFGRRNGQWSETQKLVASNARPGDLFGVKVALSGPTLAVGAGFGGKAADRGGAVYIFERDGAAWRERQIVVPNSATAGFGSGLAVAGDRMVVGAPSEQDETGAAYVFVRRADGWVEEQRLRPDGIESGSKFGFSVAVRGDRIAIGAPHPPPPGSSANVPPGQVYVYEYAGGRWEERAVLRALAPKRSDYFGASVALSASALVVGGNGESSAAEGVGGDANDDSAPYSGAVHVFATTEAGMWSPAAYLKAGNNEEDAGFGFDLALTDRYLVVAAPLEPGGGTGIGALPSRAAANSGALYVFE